MRQLPDVLFIALFFLVITALVASIRIGPASRSRVIQRELFADKAGPEQAVVVSDRIYFIKAGLVNFYAQAKNAIGHNDPEFRTFAEPTAFFHPNYLDFCCKTTANSDGRPACEEECKSISLVTSACTDNRASFINEIRTSTISGDLGTATKDNCAVSILGNTYNLVKRTVNFDKVITDIQQVGNVSQQLFRMTLTGNTVFFALSRPAFVTFSSAGLYRVIYDDVTKATALQSNEVPKRRHMFAYYTTLEKENYVYVQKVNAEDIEDFQMYQETTTNLLTQKKENPITIYYMNYVSELRQPSMVANSVTFVISQYLFATVFKSTTSITISTDTENTQNMSSLVLSQNEDLSLSLNIDDERYEVPDEVRYFEDKDLSDFHVIFTVSYDMITIVVLSRNSITKKNVCSMVRYHSNKVFKMDKALLETALTHHGLQIPENLADVMSSTSIPNYAHLALKLGYAFDSV